MCYLTLVFRPERRSQNCTDSERKGLLAKEKRALGRGLTHAFYYLQPAACESVGRAVRY